MRSAIRKARTGKEKTGDGVRAVDRALDVLMAFAESDRPMSASELSRKTKLSRPTLYRLLHTLERRGFVAGFGEPQRFALGHSVGRLGHLWTASVDMGSIARDRLQAIWTKTGETVGLFVRENDRRTCIAELPSPQVLSFKRGVGYSDAISTGASGRAILAFAEDESRQRIAAGLNAADRARLDEELARVRQRGYAISQNEFIRGATAVAAPYFGVSGAVAGSIGVFGPGARLDARIEEYGHLLAKQCALLSKDLAQLQGSAPAKRRL